MFFYLTEHQLTGQAAHAAPSFFGGNASEPTAQNQTSAQAPGTASNFCLSHRRLGPSTCESQEEMPGRPPIERLLMRTALLPEVPSAAPSLPPRVAALASTKAMLPRRTLSAATERSSRQSRWRRAADPSCRQWRGQTSGTTVSQTGGQWQRARALVVMMLCGNEIRDAVMNEDTAASPYMREQGR